MRYGSLGSGIRCRSGASCLRRHGPRNFRALSAAGLPLAKVPGLYRSRRVFELWKRWPRSPGHRVMRRATLQVWTDLNLLVGRGAGPRCLRQDRRILLETRWLKSRRERISRRQQRAIQRRPWLKIRDEMRRYVEADRLDLAEICRKLLCPPILWTLGEDSTVDQDRVIAEMAAGRRHEKMERIAGK